MKKIFKIKGNTYFIKYLQVHSEFHNECINFQRQIIRIECILTKDKSKCGCV